MRSWSSCTATALVRHEKPRIYKTHGADAVQVLSENPYRLARDIRGIGFKTADAIAMKLGVEKTAMIRVRAGISYALSVVVPFFVARVGRRDCEHRCGYGKPC